MDLTSHPNPLQWWNPIRCLVAAMILAGGLRLTAATAEFPASPGVFKPSYLVASWQTEDGLPDNSATAMVQTPDGYLWFGTFNGLVRFDGLTFTLFDRINTPALPVSGVINLHVDRRGRLWVSTLKGLVVRDGDRWTRVPEVADADGDYVRCFAERPNGDLLFTLSRGRIFECVSGRISELPAPDGEPNVGFLAVTDEDGRWWVAQRNFVGTWDGSRWQLSPSHVTPPDRKDVPLGVSQAADGGFWLFVDSELRKYSHGRQVAVRRAPDDAAETLGSVSRITEDSSGSLWVASYDAGLTQILPDGKVRRWKEADGIGYKDVRFVFEDREHNLWVGTSGGGLQRLKRRRFHSFGYPEPGSARLVASVSAGADGSVRASTFGQGLFRWDSPADFRRIRPTGRANLFLHFTSVLMDRSGRTWLGVWESGLIGFGNGSTLSFSEAELGGRTVSALFEDSRGGIWVANESRVSVVEQDRLRHFDGRHGLHRGPVRAFCEDREGTLWASNLSEVFRLVDGRFEPVRAADGSPLNEVTCLKADEDGTLWMGTIDRGVLRWRNGDVKPVDAGSGLPVRGISGILEDRRGFFWMTSREGIVRVSRTALEAVAEGRTHDLPCHLLGTHDGLPSNDCAGQHQPVCAVDSRGCFWFATSKGLASVDPEHLEINEVPPAVHVESISYVPGPDQRELRATPVRIAAPFPDRLELPPGSGDIEIQYTALSYSAPERLLFQVKTEGQNSDWLPRGNVRRERLHRLPPRTYVFRVRAANSDGVWNEHGASLAFTVMPYYWQTMWFRGGIGTLMICSGGALVWSWSRRKVRLAMERERVAEEKHRAEVEARRLREDLAHFSRVSTLGQLASALAHELSQPLSAILRNAEAAELLMKQEPADWSEIRAIISDIRKDDQRAAGVISRMRDLLKKRPLELVDIAVRDLVEDVVMLTRADALRRKVQVTLDAPPDLPAVRGDRIQLQQVLLNLFLNGMDAMEGQPAGSRALSVNIAQADPETIRLSVRDCGSGIPETQLSRMFEPFVSTKPQGLGLGLPISRTIVEAHGGRLWAENSPHGGAVLSFTLPIRKGEVAA